MLNQWKNMLLPITRIPALKQYGGFKRFSWLILSIHVVKYHVLMHLVFSKTKSNKMA